jgi:hypothetical protein
MRIIALSDIHGAHARAEDILRREGTFDVIVIAGDLTTRGTSVEAESAIASLSSYGQPIIAVAGNMDPPALDETLRRLGVGIDSTGIIVGETGFFGVSASPFTPFNTPYELSEEEIMRRAEEGWKMVVKARWRVFVPHAPPRGSKLDRSFTGMHVGSTAVREFVERNEPDVVICGHIHEARGTDTIGKSRMVNCGPAGKGQYAVVTLSERIMIETKG